MENRSRRSSGEESQSRTPAVFTHEQIDAGIQAVEKLEVMRKVWRPEEKREAFLEAAALAAIPAPVAPNAQLHPATADLVTRFADALREKLAAAEAKYGYHDNWRRDDWIDECRTHLRDHLEKGDPRDVAAYCAFLWHHGEGTAFPTHRELVMPDGETRRITQVRERGTGRVIGEQG